MLVRPTSDRAREALFNILGTEKVSGALVIDLFAGTGALGLEALSRGAEKAVFVENNSFAIGLIKKNIALCGFSGRAHVLKRDLLKGRFFLPATTEFSGPYDLVLLDPPYRHKYCLRLVPELTDYSIIGRHTTVVCEEAAFESMPDRLAELELFDRRRYGDTGFWFYRPSLNLLS